MPLLAGALTPPAPEPPPVVKPQGVRDAAQARWIAPDGTVVPLTNPDLGWFTLDAVSGLGASSVTITKDKAPRGGSTVRNVFPESRTIQWPIHVYGDTTAEFLARWRELARAFTMTRRRGPGRLVITRADGTEREVLAWYEDGFDSQAGASHTWDDVVVQLYAEDPYWRDLAPYVDSRAQATIGTFLAPYPTVSSGQVLGATTLTNPGDAEAWPEWQITGPATLITITNESTGDEFVINPSATGHGNLLAGETITVTTEPPAIRGPAGEVWTAALNFPGAVLWSLDPGASDVTFLAAGAGPGTKIQLSFHPRYETA